MIGRKITLSALLLCAFAFLLAPAQPVSAAMLMAGDATALNTAINTANSTPGSDTILLTANITLTSVGNSSPDFGDTGLVPIMSDITIDGRGFSITRDAGAPNFRILLVVNGGNLTLRNVRVSAGVGTAVFNNTFCSGSSCGGGVYNQGTLTITNSTISDNSASEFGGGIYNQGTLTIMNSTFSGNTAASNGGGVYQRSGSTLTITNSTFSGNSAGGRGGGVAIIDSGVTIMNSMFSGNTAGSEGGAVSSFGGVITITNSIISSNSAVIGGGVSSLDSFTITNSIVTGNSATDGGGAYNGGGTSSLNNSTFSANSATGSGGGAYNGGGTLSLNNSTFSGNLAPGGAVADGGATTISSNTIISNSQLGPNCSGGISGSNNLSSDSSCPSPAFTITSGIRLGPLADNGGPTPTFALQAGSIALDTADVTTCNGSGVNRLDQRGVPRSLDANGIPNNPVVGDCDIGAVELGGAIRTLQFASASGSVSVAVPTAASVTLKLDAPLGFGYAPITAYLWVTGGTAIEGHDYVPVDFQTVTFNPGDQTKTIILNLFPVSADRTLILSFATQRGSGFSGPARLGTQRTYTLTLKASPPSGAPTRDYFATHTPTLTWNRVSDAVGYVVQVDTDTAFLAPFSFSDPAIPAGVLSATTSSLPNGVYYWRVGVKRSGSATITWSSVQSFTVAAP